MCAGWASSGIRYQKVKCYSALISRVLQDNVELRQRDKRLRMQLFSFPLGIPNTFPCKETPPNKMRSCVDVKPRAKASHLQNVVSQLLGAATSLERRLCYTSMAWFEVGEIPKLTTKSWRNNMCQVVWAVLLDMNLIYRASRSV
jgi:hypothetical protein